MVKRAALITILVIIFDQLVKFISRMGVSLDYGFFRFTFVKNTGSAFGLFQGANLILAGISIVFIALFAYYYNDIIKKKDWYAYFIILGGAIANLIDRLFLGYVTDMFSFWSFPIFNIADAAITIGILIIIFHTSKRPFSA